MSQVELNMLHIKDLFVDVLKYCRTTGNLEEAVTYLNSFEPHFRSVGFESISYYFGSRGLSKEKIPTDWINLYLLFKEVHPFHIDIGLGWACAKTETIPNLKNQGFNKMRELMIHDGIGYYYGLYKPKKTIFNQEIPHIIDKKALVGFDQGLGRRLWYAAKGNIGSLQKLTAQFDESRNQNIWRGIGIACTYVGGVDEELLRDLKTVSKNYADQLGIGTCLAIISRQLSKTIVKNNYLASQIILGDSIDKIISQVNISHLLDTATSLQIDPLMELKEHFFNLRELNM